MTRFYVTTPIYYVNDVPHIGHAYTTVAGDVLTRWRPAARRRGLLPDRHRRARPEDAAGGRGKGSHADSSWSTRRPATSERRGTALDIAYDDFIRTTEPRHYRAVQEFLQKIYDAGDIELGTYEGLYCVSCEAYYSEDELGRRQLPDPRPARRARHRAELLLQALALHRPAPRALRRASRRRAARVADERGARVHPRRAAGLLDEPHVDRLGCAPSVGHRSTWRMCGPTRLFNYCTAVGYASDEARFAKWWPVDYHLVGKDILRFHAVYWPAMLMAAGLEPPRVRVRARMVARRRREDEQDADQPDRARPISSPTSASTGSATTSWPTSASVPTATSRTKRWSSATTPISRTTSATSRTACSTWR